MRIVPCFWSFGQLSFIIIFTSMNQCFIFQVDAFSAISSLLGSTKLVVWMTIVVYIRFAPSIHCCIFQIAFIFILPRPSIHYCIFPILTLPKYSLLHLSSGWRTRTLGDSRGTKHHLLLEGVSNKYV